jgi:hypothetical protein
MIDRVKPAVKGYFGEERTEGGEVEPQRLMNHSPV